MGHEAVYQSLYFISKVYPGIAQLEHEALTPEAEGSCWPFSCISASKQTHSALNINKLKPVPLLRHENKPRKPVGWIQWIFGWKSFDTSEMNLSKKKREELDDEEVPDEYFRSKEQQDDNLDEEDSGNVEDNIEEPEASSPWYEVDLLSNDGLSVPL